MKSVDPGILDRSVCFVFQPMNFIKDTLKYLTWCGHYYCTERYYMERETYPYILVIFVREGKMDVRYDHKKYLLGKGQVLLIDCRRPHYYHAHKGLEFLYMHFDGGNAHALVDLILKNNGGPVFQHEQCVKVGKSLYELVQFFENGGIASMFQEAYWIDRMLFCLASPAKLEIQEDDPVEQAIQYIQLHYHEEVSLESLSSIVRLSPSYFAHMFKRKTGYAPAEYVLKTRMENAMLLLVHSRKTVSEIAEDIGYGSSSAFINIFKRKMDMSPKTYRMMNKGDTSYKKT
jgi:AraC-like DNA-binding protein